MKSYVLDVSLHYEAISRWCYGSDMRGLSIFSTHCRQESTTQTIPLNYNCTSCLPAFSVYFSCFVFLCVFLCVLVCCGRTAHAGLCWKFTTTDVCVFVFYERFMMAATIFVMCDFLCVCVWSIPACIYVRFETFGMTTLFMCLCILLMLLSVFVFSSHKLCFSSLPVRSDGPNFSFMFSCFPSIQHLFRFCIDSNISQITDQCWISG